MSRISDRVVGTEVIEHRRFAVQGFDIAEHGGKVFVAEVLSHRGAALTAGGYGSGPVESYPPHQPALAVIASGRRR